MWVAGSGGGVPSGAAGGKLTGTYPNPSLAASSLGNTYWNPADPLVWTNVSGYPVDLPAGSGVSLHSLGPSGTQAAAGSTVLVRRVAPGWSGPDLVNTAVSLVTGVITQVIYGVQITVERPMTIDQLAVNCTAVTSPTNSCYLGLASLDAAGVNFTLLSQSAVFSITTAVPVTQSLASSQTIAPGSYSVIFAIKQSAGSITLMGGCARGTLLATNAGPFFGTVPFSTAYQIDSTHGIPSSGAFTVVSNSNICPWIDYHISAMS